MLVYSSTFRYANVSLALHGDLEGDSSFPHYFFSFLVVRGTSLLPFSKCEGPCGVLFQLLKLVK